MHGIPVPLRDTLTCAPASGRQSRPSECDQRGLRALSASGQSCQFCRSVLAAAVAITANNTAP